MRGVGTALVIAVVVALAGAPAAAQGGDAADGFVTGREHEVRIRPVLAEVPPVAKRLTRAARAAGDAAVATCDPAQVAALGRRVASTVRDADAPAACVLLPTSGADDADRLLLGPAYLTGSDIQRVVVHRRRKGREALVVQLDRRGQGIWALYAPQVGATPVALTADGRVIDEAPIGDDPDSIIADVSIRLGGARGLDADESSRVKDVIEQSRFEEVIELGRQASLSRRGREIFAGTSPEIREKDGFVEDCPSPEAEAEETFILGCYFPVGNDLYVLRVSRPDLAAVMPVTAAHELLHAVYSDLATKERRRIDRLVEEFLVSSPQPRIEESLALYSDVDRADEAHSLVGTEARDLPRALERHYQQFFDDREAVVALFEGYQRIFDDLEARYEALDTELQLLESRLTDLEGQADAAGAEADRLFDQIQSLRNQGRVDESNDLVGAQNAAVDRAKALAGEYNGLVAQFNAKVDEINGIALVLGGLYDELDAQPLEPPA